MYVMHQLIGDGVTNRCARVDFVNIGSDNGLSSEWRQAIAWNSAALLLIWSLETNFNRISKFLFKKIHLEMSAAKWWPFCLNLNMLNVFANPKMMNFLKKIS